MFMKHGVSLFIGAASDTLFPILKTHLRYSKRGDIAILVISEEDAAKIDPMKKFTRLSEVASDDPATEVGGVYGAFGYPSDRSDVDHSAQMMTMVGQPCFGLPYAEGRGLAQDFDARTHIAIFFDAKGNPHPGGMSGGGIWRMHQAGAAPEHWHERDVKLVAIEHTLGKGHDSLVGTRIEYVFGLIRSFDPSLERAINLVWPVKVPRERGRMVIDRK